MTIVAVWILILILEKLFAYFLSNEEERKQLERFIKN